MTPESPQSPLSVDDTLDQIRLCANAMYLGRLWSLANAAGLVGLDTWPDYFLAYSDDPAGARRALSLTLDT